MKPSYRFSLPIFFILISVYFIFSLNSELYIPFFLNNKATTEKPRGKIIFSHSEVSDKSLNSYIYIMDDDGSNMKNLTPNLNNSLYPSWSKNGQSIIFTSTVGKYEQIFQMDSNGLNIQQITNNEWDHFSPSWSFDGKKILYYASGDKMIDSEGRLIQQGFLMNSDGTQVSQISNNNDFVDFLSWLPSSGYISITTSESRYYTNTYISNTFGKKIEQFPNIIIRGIPIWAPDSKRFLYTDLENQENCLVNIMELGSSESKCLKIDTRLKGSQNSSASWSQDGSQILFSSNKNGNYDLYVVKENGTDLHQLSNLQGDEIMSHWWMPPY